MQSPWSLITALKAHFFARGENIYTSGRDIDTAGGDVVTGAGLVDGVDVSQLDADFGTLETAYAAHILDADAHHNWPLLDTDIPASIARDAEVTSAISTHSSSSDHDGRYFQKSEFSSSPGAASAPLETGSSGELTLAGDLDIGGSHTIFADVSANRLGVGTNSPGSRLDVNGTALFSGDIRASGGLRVGSTSGDAPDGTIVAMIFSGTPATQSGASVLYTDGSDWFFRTSGGTVKQLATV